MQYIIFKCEVWSEECGVVEFGKIYRNFSMKSANAG